MILSVDDLRHHVTYPTGADADDALARYLDAAEEAIVAYAGPPGETTLLATGGSSLVLSRPIADIISITEDWDGTPLVLSSDDYRFTSGGYVIRRLTGGTNSRSTWLGTVEVVSVAAIGGATREAVQIDLVKILLGQNSALSPNPVVASITVGPWSESYESQSGVSYEEAWDAALTMLVPDAPAMVVFG